ncbi:MAG: metal transporter substrate-binding protein [Nevskia sp.]|nr:metal transporter substrate-binding protein [Nevskia sp.]
MDEVKGIAASRGLDLHIVRFDDESQLDAALDAGKLDANSFQDLPYLDKQKQAHGYHLVDVAYTVTLPLAFYSKKLASLRGLKPGDTVALPKTPADCARALILLQNYGFITFPDTAGLHATPRDISTNPRKLKFITLAPAQLPAALDKAAFAAIPWAVAEQAGLQPARDAIGMEDARSPYANVIAVRAQDKDQPWVAQLVAAYHSEPIKHYILTHYQDSVRRPW